MTDLTIARLFAKRDRLARELAETDARLKAARPSYAARNNLLAFPSLDAMHKAVTQVTA